MEQIRLLVLRLTERCNLRCSYCYAARDDAFDMDEQTALRAVELSCPAGGSLRIQFTGGEPLLRLDLIEAVAAFGKETGRKLTLSVQTNGTMLTADVCRRLKAVRCGVGVSLDGVGNANALRVFPDGSNCYDAVVQGIQNLGRVGMSCGVTAVVTKTNAASLGQLADLALCLGNVAGVGLDLFRPMGRGEGQALSPSPEKLITGLTNLKAQTLKLEQAKIPFRFRELERLRKRRKLTVCSGTYCYAQTDLSLAVDGRGDCWPCSSLVGQDGYLLGNIQEGLPARNHKAQELAAPESCRACEKFTLCRGGCPAGRVQQKQVDDLTCLMHSVLAEKT